MAQESKPNTVGPSLPFDVPADLYPFQHKFYSINGIRIHYVDEGNGETILFLHGNPTWSFLYRDIIRGLRSNRYRCVGLDYPGFGMSGKPDNFEYTPAEQARVVESFISTLRYKDITLFVQDWGGPIGLWVATRHPEWFKRIIIGNTWAWPVQDDPHFVRFSSYMGGWIGRILITRFNFFVNVLLRMGTQKRKERLTGKVMNAYRAPFARSAWRRPMAVFPRQIIESSEFLKQVETGLGKLQRKPILLLWGMKDPAFRQKELDRFRTIFPNARIQLLQNAGHFIQEDASDDIVSAIRGWM